MGRGQRKRKDKRGAKARDSSEAGQHPELSQSMEAWLDQTSETSAELRGFTEIQECPVDEMSDGNTGVSSVQRHSRCRVEE